MPKPPDYDDLEVRQWRENAKEVARRLKEKEENLLKRIKTYIWRFGFSQSDVQEKIVNDDMFAAHFAKEPRRTGLHEKQAAEWLKALNQIDQFEVLPKSGKNAFYITSDGEVRQNMKRAPSKSLDFRWKTGQFTIFASHKFTKEGGGNQDSQFKEIAHLLEMFQKARVSETVVLLAIVDGPYYTEGRMKTLRRFCRDTPPISTAMPIEKVPEFLSKLELDRGDL